MSRSTKIDWSGFYKVRDDEGRIVAAMCKTCYRTLKHITTRRFEIHRRTNCQPRINEDIEINDEKNEEKDPKINPSKTSMGSYVGQAEFHIDEEDPASIKERLDKKLALFFFGCSIPFDVVESRFFLDFVKALTEINYKYNPPTRQTLCGSLLSEIHTDIVGAKKAMLQNTDSVLLVDVWKSKNANRKYLVFTLRNIRVQQVFLSFEDYSIQSEYGNSLSASIKYAVKIAREEYNTNVFAIITDNDSEIRFGADMTKNSGDEDLYQCTCSSHSGNLLMREIINDDFTRYINEIARIFGDSKYDSLIKSLGGTKLRNFPDTRFNYIKITCESIVGNLEILKTICNLPDVVIEQNICDRLRDPNFEIELNGVINLINPICNLINECQDPSSNIADATEFWISLELSTNDHEAKVRNRMNKAIWPVGCAANMLHPKYQGLKLNEEQKNMANTFIYNKLSSDAASELQEFYNNADTYDSLARKFNCPISFWSYCSLNFPNLSKFVLKLMVIPASTASIDSLFSNWTYIHTDNMNCFTDDRLSHLFDVFHSLGHLNL